MLARRYEFNVFVAKAVSHSFTALTRDILFLPLKHKIHIFSPLCNILYISGILLLYFSQKMFSRVGIYQLIGQLGPGADN